MSKKRHLFIVRFRVNNSASNNVKTYRTTAKSGDEAAKKINTNGASIISVRKVGKRGR